MELYEFYEITRRVIEREEDELSSINEGIYWMPELALAYAIGKEIKRLHPDAVWAREFSPPGYQGIADLFINGILVEIKLRSTMDAYKRDIVKLKDLSLTYQGTSPLEVKHKVFLCLADAFENQVDGRFKEIEEMANASQVGKYFHFPTKQNWYSTKVYCKVGMWEVK